MCDADDMIPPPIPPKRDRPVVFLSASVSPPDDSQLLTASAAFTLSQKDEDRNGEMKGYIELQRERESEGERRNNSKIKRSEKKGKTG